MRDVLLNFLAFQVAWFASILGAAHGLPLLGPSVVAIWLAIHVLFCRSWRAEIVVIVGAGLLGYLLDAFMTSQGVLRFSDEASPRWECPLWMVGLWMNLAATLGVSLRWLRGRYGLAAITGAVAGPAAYAAGERLGAVDIRSDPWAFGFLALEWGAALPALLWLHCRSYALLDPPKSASEATEQV